MSDADPAPATIKVLVPVAGDDGRTDVLEISIALASPALSVEVNRISGLSGISIDTIKVSGGEDGGGG